MMTDRERLVRIDERVGYLSKNMEVNMQDIKTLQCWKNRAAGALTIALALSGINFVM